MDIVCLDLEGVLIPEIWVEFAAKTGIDELRLTTREEPDYDVLMKHRLRVLDSHKLGLREIQEVIRTLEALPGAGEFMVWLRQHFQVVILSDTYYEFALPLMPQLSNPTLFCHRLKVAADGRLVDYVLRQKDPKKQAVKALKSLNFKVLAAGDSYNDTNMLAEADVGILFRAPPAICAEFPQFPTVQTYAELKQHCIDFSQRNPD
jgi:phosphoserine/homoserine phosphotransferase